MTSPSTLDGLPKQFVSAMRTLFDIMDDKRTGYVNFSDIENRWQDDGSKGLPKGVIESLRKVTPPNGLLTFERFCAGLKICLLRNQVENRNDHNVKRTNDPVSVQSNSRPPSAPLLDIEPTPKPQWTNTATIRPNNVISQQRTLSMPLLLPKENANLQSESVDIHNNLNNYEKPLPVINKPTLYGPPKPPRTAIGIERNTTTNIDRAEIRNALQNWQIGLMMNDENKNKQQMQYTGLLRPSRSMGDGKAAIPSDIQTGMYQKKANVRRREPRRHTLQNGIDYNMLKRIKQTEQEKDVLMQGLQAVEKAREWYLKQIAALQEKMKYLGRMGHVEPWSESQQERLELQRARVLEVNRHLSTLTESWERGGLPLHINLAVNHYPLAHGDITDRLKQQNRLLTEEVSKKSERISALEHEKASLIQVLQMRSPSSRSNGQEEAVF
ncbi:suppressor APC domain-containing protein 2 [Coccinella septempunctata]|uniref:suppressor APC domain-containing protein 2 n=1 Tax=Coccinella septempunctata TaxID=41139 RepID=UPI001D06EEAE|nr:suppressor APC domain-containing protein 2 [Coccinella septempunctata]